MPSACTGPGVILHTQELDRLLWSSTFWLEKPQARAAIHAAHTFVIGLQASGLFQSPEGDHSVQSRAEPVPFDVVHQYEMSWTCGSYSNAEF